MLRHLTTRALAGLLLTTCAVAEGPQPVVQALPADGAWATYHVDLKVEQQEWTFEWLFRSVGREQVSGIDCRWLEFEERNSDAERPQQVFKLLIPEGDFGPNRHPLAAPRRILYRRNPGDSVREVATITEADILLPFLLAGITGSSEKAAEPGHIDWSQGRLEGTVYTGSSTATLGTANITITHRQLRSDSVPFGFGQISQEWLVNTDADELNARIELTIKEAGTDAESVLK